jgi:hypothetical protein
MFYKALQCIRLQWILQAQQGSTHQNLVHRALTQSELLPHSDSQHGREDEQGMHSAPMLPNYYEMNL